MRRSFTPLLITAGLFVLLGCHTWLRQTPVEREPAFGVVADIQYGDKQGSVSRDYRGSLSRLEQCVGVLNQQPLDFVIQLGDAIDGYGTNRAASVGDLDSVLSVFNRLTAPKYHVVGNHCLLSGKKNLHQRLGLKSFYYTFTAPASKGWRFVVLDGNDAGYGVMSDAQLDWFRTTLGQAQQAGEKVICFCHFPLLQAAAESNRMAKPEPVLAALDAAPCVVAWIAGHDHAGGYARRSGVHHITLQGLVESPGKNAYARFELGAARIKEAGFGNEPSRELPLSTHELPRRLSFENGRLWPDNNGVHLNAHGGGLLCREGVYYWYGEHKVGGKAGNEAQVGVHVYSSRDLTNWKDEGIALRVSDDPASDITKACVFERPKVIFNAKTGKYVMWFHLELKGQGYSAARSGVAVADTPTGPFTYLRSERPDAGVWPVNVTDEQKAALQTVDQMKGLTFSGGQSTYILPVQGKPGAFIALFDIWNPDNAIDGRYVWLPMRFTDEGFTVTWANTWDLSAFD